MHHLHLLSCQSICNHVTLVDLSSVYKYMSCFISNLLSLEISRISLALYIIITNSVNSQLVLLTETSSLGPNLSEC